MQHRSTQGEHPAPARVRVREVAARFHRAAKSEGFVEMEERTARIVSTHDACGMVACAAGHYRLQRTAETLETEAANGQRAVKQERASDTGDWECGVRMIAIDLGMRNRANLVGWADAHPQLWGNNSGWEMFYDERAYERSGPTLTLEDIARHWDQVAKHIERFHPADGAPPQ